MRDLAVEKVNFDLLGLRERERHKLYIYMYYIMYSLIVIEKVNLLGAWVLSGCGEEMGGGQAGFLLRDLI